MKKSIECLYCGNEKNFEEMSLEHAIPQFLGGGVCARKI
ncbi:HNH endonuclease [Klebsiella pneumoniae]